MSTGGRKVHPAEILDGRELASTLGMNSSGAEWMRECEIRSLATKDKLFLDEFFAGVLRKRGKAAGEALIQQVRERQSAMEVMRVNHPYIDMEAFRASHDSTPEATTMAPVIPEPPQKRTSMFPRR